MGTERHYKPGSFYRICDRTGFATRAERTQREWQGLIVRKEVFEPRQPQDFVRGVNDIQTVPYPRPRQVDFFSGPLTTTLTTLTTPTIGLSLTPSWSLVGATPAIEIGLAPSWSLISEMLAVVSTAGMNVGDTISIMLDSGVSFKTTISSIPDGVTIGTTTALPSPASFGNIVTDLSVTVSAPIG
jgi:hypothetical protein